MPRRAATFLAVPTLLIAGFLAGCGARGNGAGGGTTFHADTGMVTMKVVLPTNGTQSTIATITTPRKIWTGVGTTDALP